ncbi:MAG TPA: VWA domain-containing protein [Rariglobus sp.]|jgi:Ca-activated chloride channel family protein|nr:VWA domain-containing protein [Rariglobus sp.]
MSFYWPHAFWLLLIPLALAAWDWRFRHRVSATNTHPKIIRAEAGRSSLVIRPFKAALVTGGPRWRLMLGLVFAIIALARPQWGRLEEPVFDQAREILIALDLSRSMLSPDVKPTRLDRAKLLITSLLEQLKGERVGLAVFSGTAFLQSPLSSDYEILSEFLPQLNPDYLPEGGTNYNALLDTSIAAFGDSGAADRFLIILSDGEAESGDWKKHIAELKAKGIRVIALGVGTTAGSMMPDGSGGFIKDDRGAVVLSKLDSSTLRELAGQTGGVYADASSWVDLAQLVQRTVDQGKRGEFKDVSRIRLAERFQWPLAPALLLLVWSFLREFPVRPKPRALRLASSDPPSLPASASLTALTFAFLFASLVTTHPVFAAATAAPATDPLAAPLTHLVGQLAARDTIAARDYADLAKTTLDYGERLSSTQQEVPPGPVNDALAAVDAGQSIDPKAADWSGLHNKLTALLKKKNPPEEDKKKQDQKQPDKNKSDQNKKDGEGQNQDQKNQDKKDDSSSKSQKSKDQKKDDSSSKDQSSKDGKGDDPKKQDQANEKKPNSDGKSAFGDMQDKDKKNDQPKPEPAKPDTQQPPGEMQQVGGTPTNKDGDSAKQDPALALPLQNLDQVKQQDSPARLYQLLQDPNAKSPAQTGHNW